MNREHKKIFRWWWSWNAEKISAWLEEMAAEGWVLERTGFAMIVFYFRRQAPRRISYCADFQSGDIQAYKAFIADSGWALVAEAGGWYLWARDYRDGEARPEFFSDTESLVARNRRLILFIIPIVMPQFYFVNLLLGRWWNKDSIFTICFTIFYLIIISFLTYAVIRTLGEIRRLKKKKY